ncbi:MULTISPECIES: hypothetical protein [unclassified Lysobacter]|uniref:hypothetical protein n=1 Tax=unclassified Lysobacter TaxID=2635362 RepID=UPI0006FF0A8E|nr:MULTISPECIES: hypothetical protein [unclassified Lysobacter]
MTDQQDKPWYTRVPAISVALLAFLVGLTTLVNNVRDWLSDDAPAATAVPANAPANASGKPAVAPANSQQAPRKTAVLLTLKQIEVIDDGTSGSTAWSFEIEGGGEELFSLASRDYVDTGADAIARPRASDPSIARVVLVPGQEMTIKITGRSSGLISRTVATGSAKLRADGSLAPIRVTADGGKSGEFVFQFATVAAPQD